MLVKWSDARMTVPKIDFSRQVVPIPLITPRQMDAELDRIARGSDLGESYSQGFDDGYSEGNLEGYEEGYEKGCDAGYETGLEERE